MYVSETFGGKPSKKNGYALGKSWLGVNVAMWKEDIARGHLPKSELYEDERFPHWWLDRVLRQ